MNIDSDDCKHIKIRILTVEEVAKRGSIPLRLLRPLVPERKDGAE